MDAAGICLQHGPIADKEGCTTGQPDQTFLCEPCSFDNDTVQAFAFCVGCIEYICKSCAKDHKKNKMTRSHKVLAEDDLPSSKKPFEELRKLGNCQSHPDIEIKYKCLDHDVYICAECERSSHRKCEKLEEITKLTSGDRNAADSLMKTIEENINLIFCHNQKKGENILRLGNDLDDAKEQLTIATQDINALLMDMKEKSFKTAESLVKEQVHVCNSAIEQGHTLIKDYETERHMLDMAITHGNNNQVHLTIHRINNSLSTLGQHLGIFRKRDQVQLRFHSNLKEFSELQIGSLNISNPTPAVEIEASKNELDNGSESVVKEQDVDICIAKVDGKKELCPDKLKTERVKTLTTDTILVRPLIESSLKFVGTHSIDQSTNAYASNIYGIVCLLDKIILIDRNNSSLVMLYYNFGTITQTSLEAKPLGLCAVNETTVVTTLEKRKVQMYQITSQGFQLLNNYKEKLNCRGVTNERDHIAILMSDNDFDTEIKEQDVIEVQIRGVHCGHKVKVVDGFEGKSGKDINLNDPKYLLYMGDGHILLGENNKISEFDPHNRRQRVYRTHRDHFISGIRGLTADDEGNIYACGWNSNNVHQISYKDFHIKRVIIPSIPEPWAIAFDPTRKRLIVSCENSNNLYEYQFTN